MIPIINENIALKLQDTYKNLTTDVKLIVFTQEIECLYCRENRNLAESIAKMSPKIKVEVYDFLKDQDKVKEYSIEMIPAIAVIGNKDYGIRFYGIPGGYEFSTFVETIKIVGTGDSGLSDTTRKTLAKIRKPINIRVFVTLTCPYCAPTVMLAHRFAYQSNLIRSEMIETSEFVPLSGKYRVYAVPKIVINEDIENEGGMTEESLLSEVIKANV